MKWLFGVLLMLCIALFAVMQWGTGGSGAGTNSPLSAELNPEKIKLLDVPAVKQADVIETLLVPPVVQAPPPPAVALAIPVHTVAAGFTKTFPLSVPATFAVASAKATAKICMEWGEFSGTNLSKSEKIIAGMKLGEKLTRRSVEYESGYWVYLPPSTNKAVLNKKISALKAAGIDEFYIVKDSTHWHNAISLGVFKTEVAAKHVLATIKKQGFRSAKMGVRKHKLKFIVFVIKGLDADSVMHLTKVRKDFPNSELKKTVCTE